MSKNVKIKICGLMTPKDVEAVNSAQADCAGFVFASGRHMLQPDQARELARALRPGIRRAGVFVNCPMKRILEITRLVPLDIIQLHGEESPKDIHALKAQSGREIWKALRVKNRETLETLECWPADKILLDAYSSKGYGGTGEQFCWRWLKDLPMERIVLAGGLTPENLREALAQCNPSMVDVSSGAETNGAKDRDKILRMVALAHGESAEPKEY